MGRVAGKRLSHEQMRDLRARTLFKQIVACVEIEISSACNRGCVYCPQAVMRRKQELMPLALFEQAVSELRDLDFTGSIAFHQYNEPLLAFEHLCASLELSASYLPASETTLFTNGDLLEPEMLAVLGAKGLKSVQATCHLAPSESWSADLALFKIYNLCKKVGLPASIIDKDSLAVEAMVEGMPVRVGCPNLLVEGSDRNGSVPVAADSREQSLFCLQMFHYLNIAYDGTGYMCCDCSHGQNGASAYSLGLLQEKGILGLFQAKLPLISKYICDDMPPACRSCAGY